MVEGELGRRLIAVGGAQDRLATEALRVAAEYEVAAARCDDIYTAVAELAGGGRRWSLVVGPLRELARGNSQFFRVAARNGARCAVLLEQPGAAERRDVLAAVGAGAWVIETIDDLQGVVVTWLAGPGCPPGVSRSVHEEFQATEAELDALLGQEADG
jgi:hypothetical protein